MSRGQRIRIEEGIFADTYGLAAVAAVGALRREKRFPNDRSDEALNKIRHWRAQTRANLLADHAQQTRQRADPRSLTRSFANYLKHRKGRRGYAADRSHAKAWIATLGPKRRHEITSDDVARAIARWRKLKKPPSEATIRHRVRVLREMYQALDGKTVAHPLVGLMLPKPRRAPLIPVAHAVFHRVAESFAVGKRHARGYGSDPVKSRARFLIYATTGQRPDQIGRALPADVDLVRQLWYVRDAKGGDPVALPLNDDMVKAWHVFIAAEAWGPFDPSSLAKVLRRHGWPAGIRPYKMRSTFAIDLLLGGADIGDVQGLLGHADITTTRKYYAPILTARMTKAVAGRSLGLNSEVPRAEVPRKTRTDRQMPKQSATLRQDLRTKQKAFPKRKRP